MKNLILLFTVATFLLTSCSSDDDSTSSQDLLIGTWTWYQSFEDGVEDPLDDCDKMDNYVVSSNGTIIENTFWNNNGTCESDGVDSATWENLGNSVYRFVYEAGTPNEESFDETIVFDGNTFYVEEEFGGITYKDVYIRN